jgi:glutaminyl-tRNA synthetase
MYRAAEALVEAGKAYVDEQSADEMRASRGDFATPGTNSPYRDRTPAENLARLRAMKDGQLADGAATLRAKIDMASPNMNLRDPALYRIKRATHHNTGDRWCIYRCTPTRIRSRTRSRTSPTRSARSSSRTSARSTTGCSTRCASSACCASRAAPVRVRAPQRQLRHHEQAKAQAARRREDRRRLGRSAHADDRRAAPARLHAGVDPPPVRARRHQQGGGWTDYASLEIALRDDLDPKAPRRWRCSTRCRLALTNWAETFGDAAHREPCHAPVHPQRAELGARELRLGPELWIERDDFAEVPTKGFFRLYPGNRVRLKYGYVVECTGCEKDAAGKVTRVLATIVADTKSGTPGADAVKVKGTLTWLAVDDALAAEVRLYDRLFVDAHPDAGGKDFKAALNPASKQVASGFVERSLAAASAGDRFQFERHGYFVADLVDHAPARRSSTAPRRCATPGRARRGRRSHRRREAVAAGGDAKRGRLAVAVLRGDQHASTGTERAVAGLQRDDRDPIGNEDRLLAVLVAQRHRPSRWPPDVTP